MWPLAVLTGDRKEMFGRFAGLKKKNGRNIEVTEVAVRRGFYVLVL